MDALTRGRFQELVKGERGSKKARGLRGRIAYCPIGKKLCHYPPIPTHPSKIKGGPWGVNMVLGGGEKKKGWVGSIGPGPKDLLN